jgi:uncharacterized membrane protein
MPTRNHIENPFEYLIHGLSGVFAGRGRTRDEAAARAEPEVRRIGMSDLGAALRAGFADFAAARDDVVFVALIYPLAGLLLAALALRMDLLPMLFPLLSGFALVGPLAAVGLYEISRRRESGAEVSWPDAAGVFRSSAIGSLMGMGLILVALLVGWLAAAYALSVAVFSPEAPTTAANFFRQAFATNEGWRMGVIGIGVGFVFAAIAFAISVVSFPLMLDRHTDVDVAIRTSARAVAKNPGPMTVWAAIVAGALAIGSLPALVGLIVVVPVLGHATWHLYRKIVV